VLFVFQQDNAPAHRARDIVEFLRSETPQFISPQLNPVNYCIWGMLQERVYRISNTNPQYGQLAEASRAGFQQSVVDDAVAAAAVAAS